MLNQKYLIREVNSSDLDQILIIEKEAHVNPWSYAFFSKQLATSARALLIEHDAMTIGYLVYHQVVDEAEILNIVTDPKRQNQGNASLLLSEFLKILKADKIKRAYLEVATDNLAAIALYNKHSFKRIGVRKNYYRRKYGPCDALLMSREVL